MELFKTSGDTPLIKLDDRLWGKLETYNPTGSVKDRMIGYIVKHAIRSGELQSGQVLVEATSGNTGIALAAIGAQLGHTVKIVMPGNMNEERKNMMRLLGAELVEVGDSDFQGAIEFRNQMITEDGCWSPRQFENPMNIECHRLTTGREIYNQVTYTPHFASFPEHRKRWAAFIHGAGTGGTIMGVHAYCQAHPQLDVKFGLVVPAEPADQHGIQGINDGADFLVDRSLMDAVLPVTTEEALERTRQLHKQGLMVGISSAANIIASERWIEENQPEGEVVTMLCDRGERYMSIL